SFALIHRPMTDLGAHIWISYSPDLRNWGGHKLILAARKGAWWDANKVGLSPPLIETTRGWLMIYHGVRHTASGSLYRLGLALFDLENPELCLVLRLHARRRRRHAPGVLRRRRHEHRARHRERA
ncbi:MAG: glycosidase-like protein, partial [bacterium]